MRAAVLVAVMGLAAFLVYAGVSASRSDAGPPDSGSADAMSIDMDPANAPANTGTTVGSRQDCARIEENNVLDADEDSTDTLNIDVTIENIPVSNPALATNFTLDFPTPNVTVTQVATPFATAHAWNVLNAGDTTAQSDGSFMHTLVDLNAAGTTGSGTISRLTLQTSPGVDTGTLELMLSETTHIDTTNTPRTPLAINNAVVAVNTNCPGVTPTPSPSPTPTPTPFGQTPSPTPSPTPTPTPTPFGQTPSPTPSPTPTPTATPTPAPRAKADVDCDGDVDAVDALKVLQSVAGLPVGLPDGCDWIADVDCDGDVDAVDALKILQFVAGLPVNLPGGCPPIGAAL